MAVFSPLRHRRLTKGVNEDKQQLVVFRLKTEYFGLPIDVVQRVIPMVNVYGDPQGKGLSLTVYEGKELVVMDVGKWIFHYPHSDQDLTNDNFLLILNLDRDTVVALPIAKPPTVRSILLSQIQDLSDTYVQSGNIDCVTSFVVREVDQPPIFILDRQKLLTTSIKFTIHRH